MKFHIMLYNLLLPIQNWFNRYYLMKEWISEGRDPKRFPKGAPITAKDIEWADEKINGTD